MGYKYQFVTLAGFHSLNHGMFELASGYKKAGMAAYAELQQVCTHTCMALTMLCLSRCSYRAKSCAISSDQQYLELAGTELSLFTSVAVSS